MSFTQYQFFFNSLNILADLQCSWKRRIWLVIYCCLYRTEKNRFLNVTVHWQTQSVCIMDWSGAARSSISGGLVVAPEQRWMLDLPKYFIAHFQNKIDRQTTNTISAKWLTVTPVQDHTVKTEIPSNNTNHFNSFI